LFYFAYMFLQQFKKGVIQGIWILSVITVTTISYAAFTTIPQETDGQPLTAAKWNILVDNVNNVLKDTPVLTGSIPVDQIRTNTCYGPTGNLVITDEWLYFVRWLVNSFRYSGNYKQMSINLLNSWGATVFSTANSIVGVGQTYFTLDGSDVIYLTAGTYTVRVDGSDGGNCNTSSMDRIFSWEIRAKLLR
jgi:hypothetical protein